ncbi:MAG TPA: hypothetical protein VF516_35940 [Kofleriaceae bacterium]
MKAVLGVLGMVAACGSGDASEVWTACPDAPGTTSRIAAGVLIGADATRVFFQGSAPGVMAWPKGGGVATRFTSEELGTNLAISGESYYWTAPSNPAITVTTARGAIHQIVPLASSLSTVKQLVAAPGGGVYALTTCAGPACVSAPPDTRPLDTIEQVSADVAASQILVSGPANIRAIAATGDALFWVEVSRPSGQYRIGRRDALTGELSTVVDGLHLKAEPGSLVIAGHELFDVGAGFPPSGLALERRNLADGTLLDAYPVPALPTLWEDMLQFVGTPQCFAIDTDLYWTQPRGQTIEEFMAEVCSVPTGLFRLRLSDRTVTSIDPHASPSPFVIDEDVVYYTYSFLAPFCCNYHGMGCPVPAEVPGPSEVHCFRKPAAAP